MFYYYGNYNNNLFDVFTSFKADAMHNYQPQIVYVEKGNFQS